MLMINQFFHKMILNIILIKLMIKKMTITGKYEKHYKYYKDSSSGLKGGAIDTIIISILPALAILTGVIYLIME